MIHSADWHLGARLIDQERREEHQLFLDWLLRYLVAEKVNYLVVAGDIFDSANPPQAALAQYYQFLFQVVQQTECRVVIVGGNHDSGSVLDAPKHLLESLKIHVVGSMPSDTAQCVLEFPEFTLCALPFLRERDVRQGSSGQQYDEIAEEIRQGIQRRYQEALECARKLPDSKKKPVMATAHLTAIGCSLSGSERDIHIGNLGAVSGGCFQGFDYVALGHIHRPQRLGSSENFRYSGSPLPMNFDETQYAKQIVQIEIEGLELKIRTVDLPCFRPLLSFKGEKNQWKAFLKANQSVEHLPAWIELILLGEPASSETQSAMKAEAKDFGMKVLKVLSSTVEILNSESPEFLSLEELDPKEVFRERLRRSGIVEGVEQLEGTFSELLSRMEEAR